MKKIESVKIGGMHYAIEYVKDLARNGEKLDGHLKHSQTKISVEANMSAQATTQTLLHEVVHVIATQIGLQDMNEDIVDALAFGIYQVMRENPDLVRMITR